MRREKKNGMHMSERNGGRKARLRVRWLKRQGFLHHCELTSMLEHQLLNSDPRFRNSNSLRSRTLRPPNPWLVLLGTPSGCTPKGGGPHTEYPNRGRVERFVEPNVKVTRSY